MKIELDKFLALTTLMAAAAVPGCTIEQVDDDEDVNSAVSDDDEDESEDAGVSGEGSDDEGDGEDAGATDEEEEGGASSADSGASDTENSEDEGGDAAACFGDDFGEDIDCGDLPYADADCGAEYALGVEVCMEAKMHVRAGSAAALASCLSEIETESACGEDHEAEVFDCYAAVAEHSCGNEDAASLCEDLAGDCDDIDPAECLASLSLLNSFALDALGDCLADSADECSDALLTCRYELLTIDY